MLRLKSSAPLALALLLSLNAPVLWAQPDSRPPLIVINGDVGRLLPANAQSALSVVVIDHSGNPLSFSNCLGSSKYDADIGSQGAEATAIGIDGTPSFVIGLSTPDGVQGTLLVGAHPYGVFEAEITKLSSR